VEALEVPFQLTVVATRQNSTGSCKSRLHCHHFLLSTSYNHRSGAPSLSDLVTADWVVAREGELTDPFDRSVPDPCNAYVAPFASATGRRPKLLPPVLTRHVEDGSQLLTLQTLTRQRLTVGGRDLLIQVALWLSSTASVV
jgi:hypothetical protein